VIRILTIFQWNCLVSFYLHAIKTSLASSYLVSSYINSILLKTTVESSGVSVDGIYMIVHLFSYVHDIAAVDWFCFHILNLKRCNDWFSGRIDARRSVTETVSYSLLLWLISSCLQYTIQKQDVLRKCFGCG
jgi:hypothetical protein